MKNIFNIEISNPESPANGMTFPVREIEGFPDHYFISDGKSHIGGGKLLRKYCKLITLDKSIELSALKKTVKLLADEDGFNTEYNRALCELVAELDPIEDVDTGDRAKQIASEIGISYSFYK